MLSALANQLSPYGLTQVTGALPGVVVPADERYMVPMRSLYLIFPQSKKVEMIRTMKARPNINTKTSPPFIWLPAAVLILAPLLEPSR